MPLIPMLKDLSTNNLYVSYQEKKWMAQQRDFIIRRIYFANISKNEWFYLWLLYTIIGGFVFF